MVFPFHPCSPRVCSQNNRPRDHFKNRFFKSLLKTLQWPHLTQSKSKFLKTAYKALCNLALLSLWPRFILSSPLVGPPQAQSLLASPQIPQATSCLKELCRLLLLPGMCFLRCTPSSAPCPFLCIVTQIIPRPPNLILQEAPPPNSLSSALLFLLFLEDVLHTKILLI